MSLLKSKNIILYAIFFSYYLKLFVEAKAIYRTNLLVHIVITFRQSSVYFSCFNPYLKNHWQIEPNLAEIVIRMVLNIIYDSFGNSAYILDQLCFLTAVISGTTCLMELLQVRNV